MDKITHLEATCPNCGQEMEVELPEGVEIKPYWMATVEFEEFNKLAKERGINRQLIDYLRKIKEGLKGWRSKPFRKLVHDNIDLLYFKINVDEERYRYLYDQFNPPIGEHSPETHVE